MAIAAQATQDRAALGIVMTLAAYAFFTLIDTSVKWLVIAGLPAFQLAFMRYAPHAVISTYLLLRRGEGWSSFQSAHMGLVLLRGFLLASATLFNFITLKYLSLTVTGSIMFSWPLLGDRVGPWRWFAIILGFMGVLVVIRPFDAEFHWIALLNVYNAFSLALYSIITRKISGIVAAETMQFYMGAFGAISLAPFAFWVWVCAMRDCARSSPARPGISCDPSGHAARDPGHPIELGAPLRRDERILEGSPLSPPCQRKLAPMAAG